MNEFKISLAASLDKKASIAKINSDIAALEKNNIKTLEIKVGIDSKSLNNIKTQVQNALSNINVNINKNSVNNGNSSASGSSNFNLSRSIQNEQYKLEAFYNQVKASNEYVNKLGTSVNLLNQEINNISDHGSLREFQENLKTAKLHYASLRSENKAFVTEVKGMRLSNSIQKWLNSNTAATKSAKEELRKYILEIENANGTIPVNRYNEIAASFSNISTQMQSMGRVGLSISDTLAKGAKKFLEWGVASRVVMTTFTALKNGVKDVRELDNALIDLKKTTSMTDQEMEEFYKTANNVAKQMGVSTKEIIDQASAWSRLGYSTAEAAENMSKYSSLFASISPDLDINQATDGLVSVMKAFDIGNTDTTEVLDGIISKINIIGNTQAVSNGDIVNILTRSSSAMKEANNTLDETIALGVAATEVTRDAEGVGTALKTIAMRIRGRQSLPPYTVMYMLCN